MSGPISIQCPKCRAKLKLKNDSAVGKKVPCPKCKQPFVVEAPSEPDDEFDDFGGLDEFGSYDDDYGDEFDEAPAAPRRKSSGRNKSSSRSPRGKKRKKKSDGANWVKPVLIGFGALAVLSLMVGVGYMGVTMLGGGGAVNNKINLAYLPPDSELFVRLQVADAWNAPLVQSMATSPLVKARLDKAAEVSGVKIEEIESVVFGAAGISETAKQAQNQPGLAGNPLNPMAAAGNLDSLHGIGVVRTKTPIDSKSLNSTDGKTRTATHSGQTYYVHAENGPGSPEIAAFLADSKTLVIGNETDVKAAIDRGDKQERRADLDFINEKHHLLFVMVPKNPQKLTGTQNQSLAGLPSQFESVRTKLDGKIRGSCLGISVSDGVQVEVQGSCLAAADATTAETEITTLLNEGKQKLAEAETSMPPSFAGIFNVAKSVLQSVQVSADGSTFAINARVSGADIETIKQQAGPLMMAGMMGGLGGGMPGGGDMPGGGLPGGAMPPLDGGGFPSTGTTIPGNGRADNPILAAREAARRSQCKNNLKMIALAMHNYHDVNSLLAPTSGGADGKSQLSWRVHVLPYLDQSPLYNQFHLDEPWDSPHNKTLIEKMPAVYACPSGKLKPGTTPYLGVAGKRAVFNPERITRMRDIVDGTSKTVMIVEVDDSRAVTWTKPEDFAYSEQNPNAGLTSNHQGGFHALLCDGSVRYFSAATAAELLNALFTINGAETIDF